MITFDLKGYEMVGSKDPKPRKIWLRLGASLHKKAKLPKFLNAMGIKDHEITAAQLIPLLKGLNVRLQIKNKYNEDKDPEHKEQPFQSVDPEAVELISGIAMKSAPVVEKPNNQLEEASAHLAGVKGSPDNDWPE